MNLRRKTGIVMLLLCMAAIAGVIWYCLFTVNKGSSHLDGTFVRAIELEKEMEKNV